MRRHQACHPEDYRLRDELSRLGKLGKLGYEDLEMAILYKNLLLHFGINNEQFNFEILLPP